MSNETEVSLKFKNQITGEKKLKEYAETLSKINSVLSGINKGAVSDLDKAATGTKDLGQGVSNISNKVSSAFNYGLITKFAGAIKRLGSGFTSLAKQSFDYLENFNLFQVAFNGNYKSAERFVNKMSEMFGLDESWLTQTIGKFKQLTNAMSLTEETGEKVAKLLTEMSLDISSLYNVDIDRAAATLSSAMAGQTKPIRGVAGADITQSTLQTTLDNLGINNTVNQLSFAEKRLLIIISLTQQLNASIGDMGRTIESPSNQLRIMNEQWERLSRAVGNVFLPILAKILPYLNAILMVLTEIISIIASLFGYKSEDYDFFEKPAASAWDLDEGLKSAGSSAKKLKQGLRGFDKLNVITTPSSSGGGGGVGGAGGVSPKLLDAFNKTFENYQKRFGDIQMKATRIRDSIMEWLGFTKVIDEETGDVSFKFDHITGGTVLGALTVGGAIYKGIKAIYTIFSKITGIKLFSGISKIVSLLKGGAALETLKGNLANIIISLSKIDPRIGLIVAAVVALTAAFVKLYKTNEEFRKKVEKLVDSFKTGLKPILDTISKLIKNLEKIIKSYVANTIKPLLNIILQVAKPILEAVILIMQKILDILNPIIEKLTDKLQPIIEDITDFLTNVAFPILGKILQVIGKIIEALSPILSPILEVALEFLLAPIKTIFSIISAILDVVDWLYKKLVKPFLDWVTDKINKNVIPAINSIGNVVDKIKKAIQKVVDWWNKLSFNKKVVSVEASSGGGFSSGGGRHYASGGLPPVGQIFVANESGPELIGHIGGQSFVANQNQMMELLDKKIGNAQNKSTQIYNIYLDKDHKVATYTLEQLQGMAKTNGKAITIG